mmetsp:Transcript_15775/g.23899  ORF Transcript_15775/g.23899 Transcript_15775/m.23899 type:complete len:205 (-) Transcript_15775:524-1138(-)
MKRSFFLHILLLAIVGVSGFVAQPNIVRQTSRHSSNTHQLSMWGNDDQIEGADRLKSCFPYLLPLLDGDHFGQFIYSRIPFLGVMDNIILRPIENIYEAIPFAPVIFFFALTLGTRRNTSLSRSVRFNAQQACLIDIMLILPEVIGGSVTGVAVPRYLMESCSNFVYYTYMAMVLYSITSNLRGQKPNQIPVLSEAAEMAVGPF